MIFRNAALSPIAAATRVTTIQACPASYDSQIFCLKPKCPLRSKKPAFSFCLALLRSCSCSESWTQSIVVKSSYFLISAISSVIACSVLTVAAPSCSRSEVIRVDRRLEMARSGSEGRCCLEAPWEGGRGFITPDHLDFVATDRLLYRPYSSMVCLDEAQKRACQKKWHTKIRRRSIVDRGHYWYS